MEIKEKNFYEVWKKMLAYVLKNGKDFKDGDRICREVFGLVTVIEEGKDPLSIIERLNKFEKWVYPNEDEIKDFLFSKKKQRGFSFGYRLFNFGDIINQIDDFVIPTLIENPYSRRGVVSLWNPKEDSIVMKKDIPSIMNFDFKLRDGKLNVFMNIRSHDIFFGFPTDAYITLLLQEYICKKLQVKKGKIIIFSSSAHIFDDHFPYIEEILKEN